MRKPTKEKKLVEMMDDDKPVPPTRNASVRDKNGSASGDKEKKRWFGGKKTSGEEWV